MPDYHPPSFDPAPAYKHALRLERALETVFDAEKVRRDEVPPPSSLPKHIFDWEDGLRVIVSVMTIHRAGLSGEYVHVQGVVLSSVYRERDVGRDAEIVRRAQETKTKSTAAVDVLLTRWKRMDPGAIEQPVEKGLSNRGVPHLLYEYRPDAEYGMEKEGLGEEAG